MSDCTCLPLEFPAVDCPQHGLFGDVRFPPMDRHARKIVIESRKCGFCGGTGKVDGATCWFCDGCGTYQLTKTETAADVQQRLYREARGQGEAA